MIAYIKGELTAVHSEGIVVENNSIGYDIKVPSTVISGLPSVGSPVKVHTYMYVREDILCLYGFLSKDDLDVFKLLIGINGIGPKGALGILSTITPDDLRFAVLSDDVATISKSPGIGNKTAQKLIIELKDKLKLSDAFDKRSANAMHEAKSHNTGDEAIQALVALGYSSSEALKAVSKVQITEAMSTEDILKLSLKKIM